MSVAQAQTTIKWISKQGTYMSYCTCDWGDVYCFYSKTGNNTYDYVPNYGTGTGTVGQPKIYMHVESSRAAENVTVSMPEIYINSTKLSFGANKICTTAPWTDVFKLDSESVNSQTLPYLQVLKNFGSACGRASFTITFKSTINAGTVGQDTIQAFYQVNVSEGTADTVKIMIYEVGTDSDGLTITNDNSTVTLGVKAYNGNGEINIASLPKVWSVYNPASGNYETSINGSALGTANTLAVTHQMVNTYATFRVEVTIDSVTYSDMQGVWDAHDPYEIRIIAYPADCTIIEGSGTNVRLYPEVYRRDNNSKVLEFQQYKYSVYDSAGNVINTSANGFSGAQLNSATQDYSSISSNVSNAANWPIVVTEQMMLKASGDVTVAIATTT